MTNDRPEDKGVSMRNLVIAGVIVILALIVISQTLYVVQETEQVVVTRFGDVKSVHTSPGLYTKAPFVDTITSYDRRLLRIDAPPSQFLDRDINILEIDVYGRYLITDPRAFLQTLTTEDNARSILAQRINSSLRAEVAERSREEIIGGDGPRTVCRAQDKAGAERYSTSRKLSRWISEGDRTAECTAISYRHVGHMRHSLGDQRQIARHDRRRQHLGVARQGADAYMSVFRRNSFKRFEAIDVDQDIRLRQTHIERRHEALTT